MCQRTFSAHGLHFWNLSTIRLSAAVMWLAREKQSDVSALVRQTVLLVAKGFVNSFDEATVARLMFV